MQAPRHRAIYYARLPPIRRHHRSLLSALRQRKRLAARRRLRPEDGRSSSSEKVVEIRRHVGRWQTKLLKASKWQVSVSCSPVGRVTAIVKSSVMYRLNFQAKEFSLLGERVCAYPSGNVCVFVVEFNWKVIRERVRMCNSQDEIKQVRRSKMSQQAVCA